MSEPVLLPPVPNPGSPDHAGPGAKGANGTNGMSVTSSKQSNGTVMTYVDPAADVSLVSVEGRVFKVDSYILKAHRCGQISPNVRCLPCWGERKTRHKTSIIRLGSLVLIAA